MCINKRVVIFVAVVALAVLAFSPRLLTGVAPFLIMAICPLSMFVMMRGMRSHRPEPVSGSGDDSARELRELEEEVNRLKAEIALRDENHRN